VPPKGGIFVLTVLVTGCWLSAEHREPENLQSAKDPLDNQQPATSNKISN
jgi:hypothetical protein